MDIQKQLQIITKGVFEIISEVDLKKKLQIAEKEKRPLRIKAGFDPSAPDLHLGHTVLLRKLKHFQDCGHEIYFLIGDFTGRIGDPTGKNELRKQLSKEDVDKNAKTYQKQVFKILDEKKTKIVFNSAWFEKMTSVEMIKLTGHATVAQLLARADFRERYENQKDISVLEFMYPLLQGYDSVHLKSDVELGGTDQKFNLLMGREMQKDYGQDPQVLLMMPILEGTDGVQKMSKSLDNYVPLDSGDTVQEKAYNMYGPLMSISDELMMRYWDLLTDVSLDDIEGMKHQIKEGKLHPKKCKQNLARMIISGYYGEESAEESEKLFEAKHGKSADTKVVFDSSAEEVVIKRSQLDSDSVWVCKLLLLAGCASSNSNARRLIEQGGVTLDNQKISDCKAEILIENKQYFLQVGKKKYVKITIEND
ncbi:MAG: tyrosine--tRNA ligase [Candidatus Ancaeobacter aquaticus]|nr:tyrosine--tRNA ligase [Candidatus Ancaeobacter aquaticus]